MGDEVRRVTGVIDVYHPALEDDLHARVEELLRDGLDLHEAVEAGLLGNPGLQAAYRNVGIAVADREQAGLLSNPLVSAALRFPSGSGSAIVDAGVFGSLADLWQLSGREAVAGWDLERQVFEVTREAAALASAIRSTFVEALATELLADVAEESQALAAQLAELAEELAAAGKATELDVRLARIERLGADVEVHDTRTAAAEARRALLERLGLPGEPPGLELVGELPLRPAMLPDLDRLQALALARRPDVRAARAHVEQAIAEVRLQEDSVLRGVDVGVVAERDDGWSIGPGVALELPLFDQNQARIARALESLAQRDRLLAAARLAVVHDVASARAAVEASADALQLYAEGLLPQAESALELARASYREGRTTLLPVIEAQREVLSTRRALVLRRGQAATAITDLEWATSSTQEDLVQAGASGLALPTASRPSTTRPDDERRP